MRGAVKVFGYIAAAIYPVLVFLFLIVLKLPVRVVSLMFTAAGFVYFLGATSRKRGRPWKRMLTSALLLGIGGLCFFTNSSIFLKLYPVIINAALLCGFGFTLFSPPTMIFRFATLQDRSIRGSLAEKRIERYCRKVTCLWCGFFILNTSAAAYTVFFASDAVWSVYNGGISYILMGLLFAGELVVRNIIDRKMPRAVPLSCFTPGSREKDAILCYEDTWSGGPKRGAKREPQKGGYKYWRDFLADTARFRRVIADSPAEKWILHCEDNWYFLTAFAALLQCGREVLLTANISPLFIEEIINSSERQAGDAAPGQTVILTDQVIPGKETLFIPALMEKAGTEPEEWANVPPAGPIRADETVIVMYTSGSTGVPKAVRQRLTEFEADNRFILSMYGEEFLRRKLCSTVSQHHIYGLLFSILLPFTVGVPFRRHRVRYPEELEKLTDVSYMIIAVPAFLKRAVESEMERRETSSPRTSSPRTGSPGTELRGAALSGALLRDPWIFTSGGVLSEETARKTSEIFGFWPVEVYGSTETSGIAYRQSKNGPEWTLFDNADISKNEQGCLVVQSPYIRDPAGFVTGDLVDILPDGRFILRGRADSVVKIEEKRISLPEVENRIMQSGLVSDVSVIAFSGRRQYLAAAAVLNGEGRKQFAGTEKYLINRYFQEYLLNFFENVVIPKKWRYLPALPVDSQGKKRKQEIEALFQNGERYSDRFFGRLSQISVRDKTDSSVSLEFSIPAESDYFDGHFPGYPLLPAVAQCEIVLRLAECYFGTYISPVKVKRLKFSYPLRPDSMVWLDLSFNRETKTAAFKMKTLKNSAGEMVTCSAGTVIFGDVL